MESPLYLLWSKVIWWVFWLCKAHPHGQNHFSIFHFFMLTGTVIVVFLSYLVWAITFLRPLAMCLHHFQGSLSEAVPTAINFYLNLCFMHLSPLKVESCLCFSGYYSTMKFLGSIAPFLQHVSSWVILWFNRSYWWSGQVGEWGGAGHEWAHVLLHEGDLCMVSSKKKGANPILGELGHFCRLREFPKVWFLSAST